MWSLVGSLIYVLGFFLGGKWGDSKVLRADEEECLGLKDPLFR